MSVKWAEKYLNRMINGKHIEDKVRISLTEYISNKSKVFKILNSLLLEIIVCVTEFDIANPILPDVSLLDDELEVLVIDFNASHNTSFGYYDTPVYHTDGAIYSLQEIAQAYLTKIAERGRLVVVNNWSWEYIATYENIDQTDGDEAIERFSNTDTHAPEVPPTQEFQTALTYWLYQDPWCILWRSKNEPVDTYPVETIGLCNAITPVGHTVDVDDLLLSQAQVLQNTNVLEGALLVMSNNSVSFSDLRQVSMSTDTVVTGETEAYMRHTYGLISNPNVSLITKISSLISPNMDAIDGFENNLPNGLKMSDIQMGNYTGTSPFNSFKNSIDVNVDLGAIVNTVVLGVKAIGSALNWLWGKANKAINYVSEKIVNEVINAKDFGVGNSQSTDIFFDVPLIQGIIDVNVDFGNLNIILPDLLTDVYPAPLEVEDVLSKLTVENQLIEIPTNFGSIFINYINGQLIYQIYLIPSKPLPSNTNTHTPFPFFVDWGTGHYIGVKTLRWCLEANLADDMTVDFTVDHSDDYWYAAMLASKVRMEYLIWLLVNHGKDLSYLLDVDDMTTAYVALHANDLFGKFRVLNGALWNTVDYLYTTGQDYGFARSGLTIGEVVILDGEYIIPTGFEPTNTDFMNIVACSQNYDVYENVFDSHVQPGWILTAFVNLLSLNSYDGMLHTLSHEGLVLPFFPWITRENPIDPRFTVNTDKENGEVISKIIVATLVVIAVAVTLYFGIKLRNILKYKLVSLQGSSDGLAWDLSQMSVNNPARNQLIKDAYKMQKKIKRTAKFASLLGVGATSLAPAAIFGALSQTDDTLTPRIEDIQDRIG